ncbi:hypothetical protein EV421DRAFT_1905434 [Armillaria borealis]|uniref:Uncharacterized protein n=1 Tax=Armillaria borealis TaxID=47425 RepID=A0AA39JCW4_9AGAR|nr:hypothetical protein EV421DRAFT_1905434 [Armillaria borealis]
MSTIVPSAKECTIIGPEQLMMKAVVLPETTKEREKALEDTLTLYVSSRQKLESDQSGAQWSLVKQHLNKVYNALKYIGDMTVIHGTALWELLLDSSQPTTKSNLANNGVSDTQVPDADRKRKPQTMSPAGAGSSTSKPQATGKKETHRSKSTAPAGPTTAPVTRKKRALNEELWKQFQSCLPTPEDPSVEWLRNIRDVIAGMGDAYQAKASATIGPELWCQLIFLNVHCGHSQTLNKTRVCKIDISDWDLVPVEADAPCKTCRTKIACQWPNDGDHSKCRKCHLQAKRCIRGGSETAKKSRKRKRASESPMPSTTRRRVVLDNDDDFDVDLPPSPSKPSTSDISPRPRPTLNIRKPEVLIPKTNLGALASVRFSSTPTFSTPSTSFPRNPFGPVKTPVPTGPFPPPKPPATPIPESHPDPDASLHSLMEQSLKISEMLTEGSAFDGEPDSEEVQKVVQTLKDLDREGYREELARTMIRLDHALKRNELVMEGLKRFATKDRALIVALKNKEQSNHTAMEEMLNALF